MSDFQDAKTKRAIFAAMTAERNLEQLRGNLIYCDDVDESNTVALSLLERISERWTRETSLKVFRANRKMASIHTELSAAADRLLREYSSDLHQLAETTK